MSDTTQLPPVDHGHQVLPDTNVLNWRSAEDSALCSSTLTALCSHTRDHNGDHEAIKADGTVLRRWRNGQTPDVHSSPAESEGTAAQLERFRAELVRLAKEDRPDASIEDLLIAVGGDLEYHRAEVERLRARRQTELDELKAKCGQQADMLARHCKTRDEVLAILDRFNTVPADDVIAETLIDSARNLLAGGAR